MNQETVVFAFMFFMVAGHFTLTTLMLKQRANLRCLNIKLDALLKAQGVEPQHLSPEVQSLALDGNKIGAIQRFREEHPEIGLAEAKAEVEAFVAKKY